MRTSVKPTATPASLSAAALVEDLRRSLGKLILPIFGQDPNSAAHRKGSSNYRRAISEKQKSGRKNELRSIGLQGTAMVEEIVGDVLNSWIDGEQQKTTSRSQVRDQGGCDRLHSLITTSKVPNRSNENQPTATATQTTSSSFSALKSYDAFVLPETFRLEFLRATAYAHSTSHGSTALQLPLILSQNSEQDTHNDVEVICRNNLTKSELVLEELRLDVASRLAVSQSLSESREEQQPPVSSQTEDQTTGDRFLYHTGVEEEVGGGSAVSGGGGGGSWSEDDEATLMFSEEDWRPDDLRTKRTWRRGEEASLLSPASSDLLDQRLRERDLVDHFLYCLTAPTRRQLEADQLTDPMKRCSLLLKKSLGAQAAQGDDESVDVGKRHGLCFGILSAGMGARAESCFPSRARSEAEYRAALRDCPVLCFSDTFSFEDRSVLPDLKQDSKDIVRDVVRINGSIMPGCRGYCQIYQKLAKELLPLKLQSRYEESDHVIRALDSKLKETDDDIGAVQFHPMYANSGAQTAEQSTSSLSNTPVQKEECRQWSEEDLEEQFCLAEIQALVLLHCVSRTLSSGQSFEKVMDVFGNEDMNLVVPNSKAAQPLDIVLPRTSKGTTVAILRSHTSFSLYPAGAVPEPLSNSCAVIDTHFISDVDLQSLTDPHTVQRVCLQLLQECTLEKTAATTGRSKNGKEGFLSERLLKFIASRASRKIVCGPVRSSNFQFRVYLSVTS